MGKITASLTVTNPIDEANAAQGLIPQAQVRSVTLGNALIDTGVTTLCLPAETIDQLGLSLLKEVAISTATGVNTARIF
jgi:predicted aspartyl protease